MLISAICPTYNESANIENILRFFTGSEPKDKELIIVDGGSNDGTQEIVTRWANDFDNIYLINNPEKYVPFALNKAIRKSKGKIIVRLDAHTVYSRDYFLKIIQTFELSKADIVGGPMRKTGKSDFQKAVAYCTSSKFGIGDSKIHDEKYIGESDHVYLGAWKRDLFNEIGFFDESLIRNQDDEFHYRAKSYGKKIFINPEIKSYYYPRDSIYKLFKQFFQYGYYKPKVSIKIKSEIKMRHLIPSIFVLYLIVLLFISDPFPVRIPLLAYFLLTVLYSFKESGSLREKILRVFVFPVIHLAYGTGYLTGLFPAVKSVCKK
ncbi:MAG: hypothetical protein Kow0098_17020 [Ignavibacteriaceae bacterium]